MSAVVLELPWPPTINHYWRRSPRSGMRISEHGLAYRKRVAQECMVQLRPRRRFTDAVGISITAYPPDRRARDLDNLLKSLIDSIMHAGVLEDDSLIEDLRIIRATVQPPGRVTVTIWPTVEGK